MTLQATGTATAGYTDNVLSAPDEQTAGTSPRESDVLFQLIPGAVLAQEAPRLHAAAGLRLHRRPVRAPLEANSYSNTLDWVGTIADLVDDEADADAAVAAGAHLDLQP